MNTKGPKSKEAVEFEKDRVSDKYLGRLPDAPSGLQKAVQEAAPEASQGPWRETAYQPRGVLSDEDVVGQLTAGLAGAGGAFEPLREAWWPALRQAVEKAGGDGIDVWIEGLLRPPAQQPQQGLFNALGDALIALATSSNFEADAQAVIALVDRALATPAKLSFKKLEREFEGKLDVSALLSARSYTDAALDARVTEIGPAMEELRGLLRAGPGSGGGIFASFTRLKFEVKLLNLESRRRKG